MKPLISVIVPVYNAEKYIEKTVECILSQTYENIELILVNDGSSDNSGQICRSLAQDNPRILFISQPNRGVCSARNAGMNAANGEFIGFCDGDDTIDPDMYEFLYNLIEQDNADISICEVRFILPNGSVKEIATGVRKKWNNTEDFLPDFLSGSVKMSVDTKLFRRKTVENVRFDEKLKTYEDKYFCFLAALNANIISSHNVAKYTYWRRPGSSSITEFNEKYFDGIFVSDEMLKIVTERYPGKTENAEGHKLASFIRIFKLICTRGGYGMFPEQEKLLLDYIKSFDKAKAKKYLSKTDFIRFRILCTSKKLFLLTTKLIDK